MFASRIAGLSVHDPEGAPVGQVNDIVVGPPTLTHGPRVLGFVVTVPGRRIFLNANKVTVLDASGLTLGTGTINLRHFSPRAHETLLVHDLLDRRLETGEYVNDVGIGSSTDVVHGWEVREVHLMRRTRLKPQRARARRTVPWQEVAELFGHAVHETYEHLREMHPVDIASAIQDLPEAEQPVALSSLDDEQLADALEEMPEEVQARAVALLDVERAADILEAMEPDDAADLLGEMDAVARAELLAEMEPEEAEPVRRLLAYPEDTAGGLMNPEPIILPPSGTVADALARLRNPDITPSMAAQVYVTGPPHDTPTGRLMGTCHMQRLLREPPSKHLGEVATLEDPEPVGPMTSGATVAARLAAYNLLALPVCDAAGRLLGVVTVDDVLDSLLPVDWRAHL